MHTSYLCSYVYSYNISYKPCTMCVPFLKNEKTVKQECMLKELLCLLTLVCLHSMQHSKFSDSNKRILEYTFLRIITPIKFNFCCQISIDNL